MATKPGSSMAHVPLLCLGCGGRVRSKYLYGRTETFDVATGLTHRCKAVKRLTRQEAESYGPLARGYGRRAKPA
jgi:hypothetical protein